MPLLKLFLSLSNTMPCWWSGSIAIGPVRRVRGDDEARTAMMQRINPVYIPRNHLVEAALSAAIEEGDLGPFKALHGVLAHPYDEMAGFEAFALPAEPSERVYQTFCGT